MDGDWQIAQRRNVTQKVNQQQRRAEESARADEALVRKKKRQQALLLTAQEYAGREREKIRRPLQGAVEVNPEQTTCLMFYEGSAGMLDVVRETSGSAFGLKEPIADIRRKCGVNAGKHTVCAEERLLAKSGKAEAFLFSISFDTMGPKDACPNCKKILDHFGIIDLNR